MSDRPRFTDLPKATEDLRWVGGMLMDNEQYDIERWSRIETYTVEHPHRPGCLQESRTIEVWEAGSVGDLQHYGHIKTERRERKRAAWRTRMEAEEEFRREVDQAIDHEDSKPPYRRREG